MQYFGFDRPSFGIKTFGFGSSEFSPLDLFAGGKQGVWYDPSDKSTLFQDIAGTVPVTKDGDPVGLMKDKSGNSNHASQPLAASRPTYRTDGVLHWLQFDGVDDNLKISNLAAIPQPFSISIAKNETYRATVTYLRSSTGSLGRYADSYWAIAFGDGYSNTKLPFNHEGKILTAKANGANSTITLDGKSLVIKSGNAAMSGDVTIFSSGTNNFVHGDLYSFIISKSPNNNSVESYLANKIGVEI